MKPPTIHCISPFPTVNNGISNYTDQYIQQLRRMGLQVVFHRLYFLTRKSDTLKWLPLSLAFNRKDRILIQYTPTSSGPLILFALLVWWLRGIRVTIVSHETPSTYAKYLKGIWQRLYLFYEAIVCHLTHRYVVHTAVHRKEMLTLVSRPIAIVPHPIFRPCTPAPPSRAPKWCVFGMISPKKNLELLLEAYQSVTDTRLPPLHIVGDAAPGNGSHLDTLRGLVHSENRKTILFRGYLTEEEIEAEFPSFSLMLFPYQWVSQSGALAYACSYSIPYLASDIPFFRSFHNDHGGGKLFPSGNREELTKILRELAEQPLEIEAGVFRRIHQNYSMERCANQLLKHMKVPLAQPD